MIFLPPRCCLAHSLTTRLNLFFGSSVLRHVWELVRGHSSCTPSSQTHVPVRGRCSSRPCSPVTMASMRSSLLISGDLFREGLLLTAVTDASTNHSRCLLHSSRSLPRSARMHRVALDLQIFGRPSQKSVSVSVHAPGDLNLTICFVRVPCRVGLTLLQHRHANFALRVALGRLLQPYGCCSCLGL